MVLGCGAALALVVPLAAPGAAQPSEQDTDWMVAAHQSNLAEFAPGNAALEQASTHQERDLGQMFVDTHPQVDADLTATAGDLGIHLPDAPTPEQEQQLPT